MELILMVYLAFRNGVRARTKGLNAWLWGGITVLSFVSAWIIGFYIVILFFTGGVVNLDQMSSVDPAVRKALVTQLVELMENNHLHYYTIEIFSLGGYLLIRYILDKKEGKKQPEVHWTDRLGENR